MAEYISREAVWSKLEWDNDLEKWVVRYGCDIDDIPAADVVPVMHGKWIAEWSDCYLQDFHHCSLCGQGALTEPGGDYEEWLTGYCPNCGARMEADGNG